MIWSAIMVVQALATEERPPMKPVLEGVVFPEAAQITIASETIREGNTQDRVVRDDASIVLFYGGEQAGDLGPCGCASSPQGGVARVQGYISASRRANPMTPDLLLNVGNYLDDAIGLSGALRPDAVRKNAAMMEGLGGWDVLNVGSRDHAWFETTDVPEHVTSAVLTGKGAPASALTFERGEHKVVVIGVNGAWLSFSEPSHTVVTPVEAVLAKERREEDLVVVVALDVGRTADELARIPGVDVVIEGGRFKYRSEAVQEGNAVWVRSAHQTQRIGELRLWIDAGRVVRALDRHVGLDDRVRADPDLERLSRKATREVERAQKSLFATEP